MGLAVRPLTAGKAHRLSDTMLPRYCGELERAMRPRCLLRCFPSGGGLRGSRSRTRLLPVTIDTQGPPCFIGFTIAVAQALNGSPLLGFVDADNDGIKMSMGAAAGTTVQEDLSRPKVGVLPGQAPTPFAVACCPSNGQMHLAMDGRDWSTAAPRNVVSSVDIPSSGHDPLKLCAFLQWPPSDAEMKRKVLHIHAGFLIENGKLTFFRRLPNECWLSSGVVLEDLPRRVVPGMFLYGFDGFARVHFTGLQRNAPDLCPRGAALQGYAQDWHTWPWVAAVA